MTWRHELALGAPGYPRYLAAIKDAPATLYVKGDAAALALPCVSVVGMREASGAGKGAALAIGEWLARRGVCVVSGAAEGIDTSAHEGALAGGGPTVAVLGHGLQMAYPKQNAGLADRIVASGGALATEYAEGTRPAKVFFVRRDRIITGLSLATVLVESRAEGGSMHAVRFAREQTRPIFAVASGAAGFCRDGAEMAWRRFGATWVHSAAQLWGHVGPLVERWREGEGR